MVHDDRHGAKSDLSRVYFEMMRSGDANDEVVVTNTMEWSIRITIFLIED